MLVASVHYCMLLDSESLKINRFYSVVIHVGHPRFPLNGIKKCLAWLNTHLCVCVCVCSGGGGGGGGGWICNAIFLPPPNILFVLSTMTMTVWAWPWHYTNNKWTLALTRWNKTCDMRERGQRDRQRQTDSEKERVGGGSLLVTDAAVLIL